MEPPDILTGAAPAARARRGRACAPPDGATSVALSARPAEPAPRRRADRPPPPPAVVALETLLSRVADGDQAAYAALYDRVAGQVYGLVLRVLRDPSQSEEVAQDVLVEVWRLAARFDPARGSANTWIMTMAHRRAVDRVRSEQARRRRERRVTMLDERRAFDSVAEEVETRSRHEQVRQALDELTDLRREAVELAYYGGRTYREVAELLDTPLGTVKTRLRDGLIRLRETMVA